MYFSPNSYSMIELGSIIVLGIAAQWVAWKLRVPAILPLILTGLFVGPISTLFTDDGGKWLEPVFQNGEGLFPGDSLFYFTSLAIGLILFEGGLTLKRSEIRDVGPAILNLIILGSFITFVGAGISAHFFLGLSWKIAFLFAGLVIVTGPTVIAPILRNMPLNRNVSTVLKWEGILIDPLGALVAVLVFEFIISGQAGQAFGLTAIIEFGKIVITGFLIGFAGAWIMYQVLKRRWVPHYLINVFSLAFVLLAFVASDEFAHESGLLTVVVMGMVLANLEVPGLKDILSFKESISVLLISILFILLSANVDLDELALIWEPRSIWLFLVLILVLRPLGVFLSTGNSTLNSREKLFISWVGPRGIVAAGVASLFGTKLVSLGVPGAEYITPLVFMIVMGTVLLNATTARPLAKILGVIQKSSSGILIIGANKPSRMIASYLQNEGRHVVMVDSNPSNIQKAKTEGISSFQGNIYSEDFEDNLDLLDVGYLLAMTGSADVNKFACEKFKDDFGELGTYRLISSDEMQMDISEIPEAGLFSANDDYINLSEVARDYPQILEKPLKNNAHLKTLLDFVRRHKTIVPLFLKDPEGELNIIPAKETQFKVDENWKLVYMGKEIETSIN